MRHTRHPTLGAIGVAALTLGLALSGCGVAASSTTTLRINSSTATPSPASTATVSPDDLEADGCPAAGSTPQYVAIGALKVLVPTRSLDYPSELISNPPSNAPYQIAASVVNNFDPHPAVNPHLSLGYFFQVCNVTSAPHTLSSLTVDIASFTPSTGPVNVWRLCTDGPYDSATKHTGSGCGGGVGGIGLLAATLPSDSTGASAPATASTSYPMGGMSLPATIGPNKSIGLAVAVNGLTSQGTYSLSFGLSVDGAIPTLVTPSDGSFLIAPSAIVWTGNLCQTPAMQAQIPAATHDTYYVCPPTS
jgi:hypothetical protein